MRFLISGSFWVLMACQSVHTVAHAEEESLGISDPIKFLKAVKQKSADPAHAFREQLKLLRKDIDRRKEIEIESARMRDLEPRDEPITISKSDMNLVQDITFRIKLEVIDHLLTNQSELKDKFKQDPKALITEQSQLCADARADLLEMRPKDVIDPKTGEVISSGVGEDDRTAQEILELFCPQIKTKKSRQGI